MRKAIFILWNVWKPVKANCSQQMLTAAIGGVVSRFALILLWSSTTTSYLNERTRPLLETWLGKYSPLLLCVFIIPSCTVETNTQVYLLSHNKQHSIYLYHFPVTFPYCTSSSFFRLMTMTIKMTEDDLWPRGFLIELIKCLKKSLVGKDCKFSVMTLWM